MRIGVVSDTHNHLPNVRRLVTLFNAAGVARVVHTGDVTQAATLAVFGALRAPLVGVYGNNDECDALGAAAPALGADFAPPPRRFVWAGRAVTVVHDPKTLAGPPAAGEVVLHGHEHRLVVCREGGGLVFNPGECAGHLAGHNAVGVLDLATLAIELLRF